jgi:hypothetical protein
MKITRLLLTALAALTFCGLASAATLPFNTWETEPFTLMNSGDFFPDVFVASGSGTVLFTGYYVTGDYYDIYDDGTLALTTVQVLPANVDYGDELPSLYADPASAYASGLFSTGSIQVQGGDQITIADLDPPGGIGEVGLELVPVPEPETFAMAAAGLLTLAAMLRRRRSS